MRTDQKRVQIFLTVLLSILAILTILPFISLVSISFSEEKRLLIEGYSLLPRGFDTSGYEFIFKNPEEVLRAYGVTIFFSFVTMAGSLLFMIPIAYTLSKRNFRGKRVISLYLYFTMLFSGGLVPTYILLTQYLHLRDSIWVYILPSLLNVWQVFLIRTGFQSIPYELSEAAIIDGADDYTILFKIIVPLSKPVLACIALGIFLGQWNNWYTSMLYIDDRKLQSLQYMLQRIMMNLQELKNMPLNLASTVNVRDLPGETIRMAMAVVAAGPALVVFPFFQKYFVRGVVVGSVKG